MSRRKRCGDGRHFIVGTAVQGTAVLLLLDAAPLLEEELHALVLALLPNRLDPGLIERSGARAALAADDDPLDPIEVQLSDVLQERLDREESHLRRRRLEVLHTRQAVPPVLHADAPPDVRRLG